MSDKILKTKIHDIINSWNLKTVEQMQLEEQIFNAIDSNASGSDKILAEEVEYWGGRINIILNRLKILQQEIDEIFNILKKQNREIKELEKHGK